MDTKPLPPDAPPRVLLVNLNTYDQPYPVYPLGLAYIDGALREAGYETHFWDARASGGALEEAVARFRPGFIAVSLRNIDNVQSHNPLSFVRNLSDCCAVLRKVTRAPIIVGGSAFSIFPSELLELTGADYGIRGEGETSLVALLAALRENRTPDAIPGVVWRPDGRAVRANECTVRQAGFTAEPLHTPGVLSSYVSAGSIIGVQTQRGCPLKCCYCTYPYIEGKRSRYRTGAQVVEEMRRLQALGVEYTFIVDSVFNTNERHLVDVCEALCAANLGMEWECFLSPRALTRDHLALMKRAGMRHVEFGSDSFSDPVLKSYGKAFAWEDIRRTSAYADELGILYGHFLIFGGPGETPDTVEQTLARASELERAYYFATIGMRIFPGTPLWEKSGPPATGETREAFLATPRFHVEPPLTVESLYARLDGFRSTAPNWVVGDPPSAFAATMKKLRNRGLRGPLWEYIEILQRYQQAGEDR